MAVDSQAKRFAMLGFVSSVVRGLVVVDASVSTEDRLSWLSLYNGITLDAPVASYSWYSPYRRRRANSAKMVKWRVS